MTSNNPPNMVPNVPVDPYSDPSLSYYSLPYSSDSPDDKYYKQRRRTKKDKNKYRSKTHFDHPIKNCTKLTSKLLKSTYKSKFIKFKLYKDTLQHRVYLTSFINSLKYFLSKFIGAYMLLMDYPSIRGEE